MLSLFAKETLKVMLPPGVFINERLLLIVAWLTGAVKVIFITGLALTLKKLFPLFAFC
jgi:hypothetical protein